MTATKLALTGDDGFTYDAYHVPPAGKPKGGLVVAMEIFGVNAHIRKVCEDFAAEGYEVIAPALFDRAQPGFEVGYTPEDFSLAAKHTQAVAYKYTQSDIQAAIDFLHSRGSARIHMVGYCYGGSVTWVAACRCTGLTTAVSYYGRQVVDFADEKPRCPMMLHFGRSDDRIPMDVVEQIRAKRPDVPIHLYDAGHAFNNSDRPHSFDAAAARIARERTLAFFETAR